MDETEVAREVVNLVTEETDSWAEALNRLRRAQGRGRHSPVPHRAATGTPPCAERGRTGEAVPDPRTLDSTAAESFARVRHYVPVPAFKRASRQLSGRYDARDDAGGAA